MLPADLGDRAALARVEDLLREDASITLLVNNAGIGTHTPLLQSDVEQMTRMVDLNVTAPMRLAYAVAPAFVARGRGAIINIASIVAIAPELLNGVYGGSKAFVLAFSQSLRHELAAAGVQVQAVLPGATATDFWAIGGRPVENLDPRIVMRAEDLVDAALLGFERGEAVTIPRCMPARNGTPTTPRAWPWLASCPAIPLRRAMRQPVDVSLDPGARFMPRNTETVESLFERQRGTLPDTFGLRPLRIADGRMTMEMTLAPWMMAPNGYLHAATQVLLADTCAGYATLAHLPEGPRASPRWS